MKRYLLLGLVASLVLVVLPVAAATATDWSPRVEVCHEKVHWSETLVERLGDRAERFPWLVTLAATHAAEPDSWDLKRVSQWSANRHLSRHADDGTPGGVVPGMDGYEFDESCSPVDVAPTAASVDLRGGGEAVEGDHIAFSVTVDKPQSGPIAVQLQLVGTGDNPASPGDIVGLLDDSMTPVAGNTVTIPAYVASVGFYVSTFDDYEPETTETFDVRILDVTAPHMIGTPESAQGTIFDNADDPIDACASGGVVTIGGTDFTLQRDGTQIVSVTPSLVADGFQDFTASTCGWTNGHTLVNIFQTGVTDLNNGWDEEHALPTTSRMPADNQNPQHEFIGLAIDHVNSIGELTGADKTLFNSSDASALTFAVRVYAPDGSLADCVAWGHDVSGMFAGLVPDNNSQGPTNPMEISSSNCTDVN